MASISLRTAVAVAACGAALTTGAASAANWTPSTTTAEAPWVVAVTYDGGSSFCSGVLIAPDRVLTSSGCVLRNLDGATSISRPEDLQVMSGSVRVPDPGADRRAVARVRVHPFALTPPAGITPTSTNLIAVLELATPFAESAATRPIRMVAAPAPPPSFETPALIQAFGGHGVFPSALSLRTLASSYGVTNDCAAGITATGACVAVPVAADGWCPRDGAAVLVSEGGEQRLAGITWREKCYDWKSEIVSWLGAGEIRDFVTGSDTPPVAPRASLGRIWLSGFGDSPQCTAEYQWITDVAVTYEFWEVRARVASPLGEEDWERVRLVQSGASPVVAFPVGAERRSLACIVVAVNAGGIYRSFGAVITRGGALAGTGTGVPVRPATGKSDTADDAADRVRSRASITSLAGVRLVARDRTVRLATVHCQASRPCRVTVASTVRVRIAGRTYTGRIARLRTVAAGKEASLRLRLSRAAVKRLRGRKTNVRLPVRIVADGQTLQAIVRVRVGIRRSKKAEPRESRMQPLAAYGLRR